MPRNTVHLTVTVTPELGEFVRARVASGAFASQSEVVRAGLRALRRAEPEDPWAESPSPTTSGRRPPSGPRSSSGAGSKTDKSRSGAGSDPAADTEAERIATDRARLRDALPTLHRHGRAVLRLCEEYGAEHVAVPFRELNAGVAEDERELLRLVVDADPHRIYPVTAELGRRIGELLGIFVWMDERSLYQSNSSVARKSGLLLDPLFPAQESGDQP